MNYIRFLTHLTLEQLTRLRVISRQTKIPVAELIRQAIDAWLVESGEPLLLLFQKNEKKKLK